MRSETVVLPASMCAAMPMLRTFVKSRAMGRSSFHYESFSRRGYAAAKPESTQSAAGVGGSVKTADPKLPGIVLWDDSQAWSIAHTDHAASGQHEPANSARSSRELLV